MLFQKVTGLSWVFSFENVLRLNNFKVFSVISVSESPSFLQIHLASSIKRIFSTNSAKSLECLLRELLSGGSSESDRNSQNHHICSLFSSWYLCFTPISRCPRKREKAPIMRLNLDFPFFCGLIVKT